ncbi:SPASM domain-containing protein [Patescibacteria group bacterium]|nr:SPASM domain-containing protein [Patescibacteria group bacterium]
MDLLRWLKNQLESSSGFNTIFDRLASTNFYKKFIFFKINRYTRFLKSSRQLNIVIETTNSCNARCIMCPQIIMKRPRRLMDQKTFNLIIKRLHEDKIQPLAFILNGFGDPFTDPQLITRIQLLKNNFPHSFIKIYSNFALPSKPLIDSLLDSGLDELNISFNGFDKTSYEKVMKLKYSQTVDNINYFLSQRKLKKSSLKVRLSMALVSDNDNRLSDFINFWKDKVDSVSTNRAHSYSGAVANTAGHHQINYTKTPFPCKYLWNTIVINNLGQINLCCLDYESKYNFGNIEESSLLSLFYGQRFSSIRKKHLKQDLSSLPICQHCYTPYKNGVEWLYDKLY